MKPTSTTYRMILSDGSKLNLDANNAGEAIEEARWRRRGLTVTSCHSGMTQKEADALNSTGVKAMPGIVEYEIPPHDPVSTHDVRKPRGRLKDQSCEMFKPEEISPGRLSTIPEHQEIIAKITGFAAVLAEVHP